MSKSKTSPKRRNRVAQESIGGEKALKGGPHGKTKKAKRRKTKTDLQKTVQEELEQDRMLGPLLKKAKGKYRPDQLRSYVRGMATATQSEEIKKKLLLYRNYI